MWEEKLKLYDQLIDRCPDISRKGKSMPYTSANGHMFSQLNKAGEIGIRFSPEVQKRYLEEWNTTVFKSYNSVMKGYVLIPENMLKDLDNLARFLIESYQYVLNLEPK